MAAWLGAKSWRLASGRGILARIQGRLDQLLGSLVGPPCFRRVYFGNEFCQERLPALPELREVVARCREGGLGLTLLAPPVTDAGLERLGPVLARLEELLPTSEVVFNDWGVMELLFARHRGLCPVMGRNLLGVVKDPRVPLPPAGDDRYPAQPTLRGTALALPAFREALRARGVGRVEVDLFLPRCDLDFRSTGLEATLVLPFSSVASGRVCLIGSLHQPPERKFTLQAGCGQECGSYLCELESACLAARLFHRGNTAFALQPPEALAALPRVLEEGGYSRVAYDPEMGF